MATQTDVSDHHVYEWVFRYLDQETRLAVALTLCVEYSRVNVASVRWRLYRALMTLVATPETISTLISNAVVERIILLCGETKDMGLLPLLCDLIARPGFYEQPATPVIVKIMREDYVRRGDAAVGAKLRGWGDEATIADIMHIQKIDGLIEDAIAQKKKHHTELSGVTVTSKDVYLGMERIERRFGMYVKDMEVTMDHKTGKHVGRILFRPREEGDLQTKFLDPLVALG